METRDFGANRRENVGRSVAAVNTFCAEFEPTHAAGVIGSLALDAVYAGGFVVLWTLGV
jgi:hypothetical protein